MTLLENIQIDLKISMKSREVLKTSVLRNILSNIQTMEATGKPLTEEQGFNLVKKLINQNNEEIATRTSINSQQYAEDIVRLNQENEILSTYLPTYLTSEEILEILQQEENIVKINSARNVGAAIGMAMGILKAHGKVEGETVKTVVSGIKNES